MKFQEGDRVHYIGVNAYDDSGDYGRLSVWDEDYWDEPGWWVTWDDGAYLWASENELELVGE